MYRDLLKHYLSISSPAAYLSHIDLYAGQSNLTYLCQCQFNIDKFHEDFASTLRVFVPQSIIRSVRKRQAEFIAGRYMTKQCFKLMTPQEYEIDIGDHREPIWPIEYVGAISHTSNQAIALVSKRTDYHYIGLDIENFLDYKIAKQIATDIHNRCELLLFSECGINDETATSIIFSAKESLFKATFSYIGKHFGFECARVIEVNSHECFLVLALDISLSRYCKDKKFFQCYYFLDSKCVTTIILN